LSSIEWNPSGKIRAHPHRQLIDNAAAKAETESAEFSGAARARFQPICRGKEIFSHLRAVELSEKR